MRILFIGAASSSHTVKWVNSLAARGHDVLLVSKGDHKSKSNKISNKVTVYYLRYGGGKGYFLNVPELRRICNRFNPDIVNAHYATGYATLARLAKVRPLLVSFWGSDIYDYPYHGTFNKRLLWKNIAYADGIASTSHVMAHKIKEVYPLLKKEIFITPFGVDTQRFKPTLRERNSRPTIGIVKSLEPIYDIPLLIQAFALASKRIENLLLHIYGGGSQLEELKKLCKTLGVEDNVIFKGEISNDDVPKAINTMDVFVNCSHMESFGVALVEAMACEVPVIATDTEGFREVVVNGVTGIVLRDRSPEMLADAILQVLGDPAVAKRFGQEGRKRVLEIYDWQKNVSTMEEVYNKVTRGVL